MSIIDIQLSDLETLCYRKPLKKITSSATMPRLWINLDFEAKAKYFGLKAIA